MQNFRDFIEECERAPRLNEFTDFFENTASGRSGMPLQRPIPDYHMLGRDATLQQFAQLHERRQGPFDQHYLASIPYRLEEECRLGVALLKYAAIRRRVLNIYTLGTAEGTMARTVSELAQGNILSLACSPNIENQLSFYQHGTPPHATFFHGAFHRLTKDRIHADAALRRFESGFDVILEDTTFQMYSRNRHAQIAFVSQHLRDDGLLLLVEKFKHADAREYARREEQKDFGFKARYFSPTDIAIKREKVLSRMGDNEVTLDEVGQALKKRFQHCMVTWNSGNFYTLVASNNFGNIQRFLTALAEPLIPAAYVYQQVPASLYTSRSSDREDQARPQLSPDVGLLERRRMVSMTTASCRLRSTASNGERSVAMREVQDV